MANEQVATGVVELKVEFNTAQLQGSLDKLNATMQRSLAGQTASVQKSVSGSVEKMTTSFKNFAENTLQNATRRVVQFGSITTTVLAGLAIKGAANLETLKVALNGIFGPQAEKAFQQITDFAAKTPFQINDVASSVIKLASTFHFTSTQALEFLKIVGDAGAASGATADQMNGVVVALTQISARGKLSAQDLHQVSSAFPNVTEAAVFAEIAKEMHITQQAAQDMADQGLIPSNVAISSILQVMREVPGAAGAMGRQANTLNGIFSTLKDTFNIVAFEALKPLIDLFEGSVGTFLNTGNAIKVLTEKAKEFGTTAASAIKGFITDVGPQLKEIFNSIKDVFGGAIPTVENLAGTFAPLVKILANLVVIFSRIADVINPLLAILSGTLAILLRFDVVQKIITTLVALFVAWKVNILLTSGALNFLNTIVLNTIERFTLLEGIQVAGALFNIRAAIIGMSTAFSEMIPVIGVVVIAMNVINSLFGSQLNSIMGNAKLNIQDVTIALQELGNTGITAGLDIGKLSTDVKDSFSDSTWSTVYRQISTFAGKLNPLNSGIEGSHARVSQVRDGLIELAKTNLPLAEKAYKSLHDQLLAAGNSEQQVQRFLEPVTKELKIQETNAAALGGAVEGTSLSFGDMATALSTVSDRFKSIIDGSTAINRANLALSKTNQNLAKLESERSKLLKDTASQQREVAAGADAVLKANNSLRDLDEQSVQLKKELIDLQGPKAADEAASAQIKLERATIAYNDAVKAQLALTQKKNSLDLTGLTLDQIRTKLADARAKPHSAPDNKVAEAANAELDVRQAILDKSDAQRAVDELKLKNQIDIRENLQAQSDLEIQVRDAKRQQADAQEANAKLQAGETTRSKALKDINQQITDAKAQQAVDAQAVADATQKQNELLNAQIDPIKTGNQLFLDRYETIKKINNEAARTGFIEGLPALLKTAQLTGANGQILSGPVNPAAFTSISSDILKTPAGADLKVILKELLRKAGLTIPGLAEGGFVNGAAGAFGQLHRLGEYGKAEAVLPLTKPGRMTALMADSRIQGPVLDALPGIGSNPNFSRGGPNRIDSGKDGQAAFAKLLAKEIVAEQKANGMNEKGEVTLNYHADPKPTRALSAREVQREMEKALKHV